MASLSPSAKQQFFTNGSVLAAGYLLYTYASGTTTPLATYTDKDATVANTNPIVLDARGEAILYLQGAQYRYVLKDAGGSTIWTRDNISCGADASDLASTTPGKGSDIIGFPDALAPTFLKTTSDIINGERVSIMRAIPQAQWAAIRAQTSTYDVFGGGVIQQLINDMDSAGFGDLYVPGGLFSIGSSIALPSNFRLTGVPGRTWFKPISATYKPTSNGLFATINTKSNVMLYGIGVDGDYINQTQAFFPDLVHVTAGNSVILDTCYMKNSKGIVVAFQGDCAYSGVRNSVLTNNGKYNTVSSNMADRKDAIWFGLGTLSNCLMNFVENNTITDTGLSAVDSSAQLLLGIKGNRITRTSAGALYLSANRDPVVSNNTIIQAGGNGIDSYGSYGFSYTGNSIHDGVAAGIMVGSQIDIAPVPITGVVAGNILSGNCTDSASVHKGQITLHNGTAAQMANVVIEGNTAINSTQYGFYVVPLGATSTTSRTMGTGIIVGKSNTFSGNTLGDFAGLDNAFRGASGKRTYTLAAGASMAIMPATGGGSASYALIDVVNTSSSQMGTIFARGTGTMQILVDPATAFSVTDAGTTTAVFYDATSGNILLKNRTAGTVAYAVDVRGVGSV